MPLLPAHWLPCVASRLPFEGLRAAAAEAALASGHRLQGALTALSGMALPAPNSLLQSGLGRADCWGSVGKKARRRILQFVVVETHASSIHGVVWLWVASLPWKAAG